MAENKLTEIIEASLEQIKQVVDANTIIGTPINTPNGTTVIPVSKVMVGFASGGVDYLGKNMKKVADSAQTKPALQTNFGGGGGTGVTVQPVGFLVISPNGDVQLLNVGAGSAGSGDKIDSISNLIEKTPDIVSKIKDIFSKNDKPAEKVEETPEEDTDPHIG
ncbi:MAG: sporulation protein YtfJ [Clostridia bacterium]|nr:sporulation protein YtfJ [Clostridia bacterium]